MGYSMNSSTVKTPGKLTSAITLDMKALMQHQHPWESFLLPAPMRRKEIHGNPSVAVFQLFKSEPQSK